MSRAVSVFVPVVGDPDGIRRRFSDDPGTWLPSARACGPARWHADVRYRGLHRPVEVRVGGLWHVGATTWRSLVWHPLPDDGDVGPLDRLLPTLTAELGLHAKGSDASLVLSGTYEPPGAALGELADAVLLHRVAERTVRSFLQDLAVTLARPATVPG